MTEHILTFEIGGGYKSFNAVDKSFEACVEYFDDGHISITQDTTWGKQTIFLNKELLKQIADRILTKTS
jgi:hypothetical protein